MLPVMAPWSKISEVIDYVREVKPQRAYDIHDALLTDLARPIYDRQIGALGGAEHLRLAPEGERRTLSVSAPGRLSGMRIATWNVNSITARLPRLLAWLESSGTDVLCLQEAKIAEEQFPVDRAARGWATRRRSTRPAGGTAWR